MSLQIVPMTDEQVAKLTEKPKLAQGHYKGVIVAQKLKTDAEGYPVLSQRPKTEGCPELLLTIKPLANPDDFGSEVDVPVFHTLPLALSTKRADGSTVEISKESVPFSNGMLGTFIDLPRYEEKGNQDAKKEAIRATEQASINLAQGATSLINTAVFFTVEHNGQYVNIKRFRRALKEGETLVAPQDMVV